MRRRDPIASRSEIRRRAWRGFQGRFRVRPGGSVAYEPGLVAGGAALVLAAAAALGRLLIDLRERTS